MTPEVERVLSGASFCHLGTVTPSGPHVTPVVFVLSGGRLWATTARSSTKARAWRVDPRVGGLVRDGDEVVTFTGRARTHDALDPLTWIETIREAPALALATVRFARKNARFFAGYAVDARSVPFAWLPPGRLLVEIQVERSIRWTSGAPSRGHPIEVPSTDRFRAASSGVDALQVLPAEVAAAVNRDGAGQLGLETGTGISVLPVRWAARGPGLYAVVREALLASAPLPGASRFPVALGVDRPTWWRARNMAGAMVQGTGEVAVLRALRSGHRSAMTIVEAAGADSADAALIRIAPRRVIWWQGWSSGSRRVGRARSRTRTGGA